MKSIVAVLFVVISLLVSVKAQAVVLYTLTDLGTFGGTSLYKSGAGNINNSGQVVGIAWPINTSTNYAFRTAPNQPINPATDYLGTLGGKTSIARGINKGGQVVGDAYTSTNEIHAFRTAANQPINRATDDLGTLGGSLIYANAINDSGQVVGTSTISLNTNTQHAFRTAANQSINPATDDLGTLGGLSSFARGLNNSGQVVGYAYFSDNFTYHAFRTTANQPINPLTDDLGTLGGVYSFAYDINDSGLVVGASTTSATSFTRHAFRTVANQSINPATDDLGTLGGNFVNSDAYGVNASGQVVGDCSTSDFNYSHAFLYTDSGPIQDLNELIAPNSGWTLNYAIDINNLGQIVGQGTIGNRSRAFLLTPIPEPSTFAMLLSIAVGGVLWWKRRQA
jgi:probable HAF family extracellular repeat protein